MDIACEHVLSSCQSTLLFIFNFSYIDNPFIPPRACSQAIMDIMTHTKFHFNRLMSTLIFGVWASEFGPGERLKRPGLIGLKLLIFWVTIIS